MATTSLDFFRAGNASSAKLDQVRPIDVTIYTSSGIEWVKGRSGGISTYASVDPTLSGRWWRLPAGSSYDDAVLYVWSDHADHWSWEPDYDMPLASYRAALTAVSVRFVKV
jgi:hypothetical protein